VALAYEEYFAERAKEAQRQAGRNNGIAEGQARGTHSNEKLGADPRQAIPAKREPRAADRAAKMVGASTRAVQQAKALKKNAPDLLDQVRSGGVALDTAYKQHRQRERVAPKPEPVKPATRWSRPVDPWDCPTHETVPRVSPL
jgi:hypothetical protein